MMGGVIGSSVFDPENLLLDEAEFFVVGRSSEELGDQTLPASQVDKQSDQGSP